MLPLRVRVLNFTSESLSEFRFTLRIVLIPSKLDFRVAKSSIYLLLRVEIEFISCRDLGCLVFNFLGKFDIVGYQAQVEAHGGVFELEAVVFVVEVKGSLRGVAVNHSVVVLHLFDFVLS